MDGEARVLRGLVDEELVARAGPGGPDLRGATGRTEGGVRAQSALPEREDVRVRPPRRSTVLELPRDAELPEVGPLDRDVRRVVDAPHVPDRPEVRT
ncbi:hypothetical protein PHK61_14415 [Actinomycetospora lutea]|uniref:hypothetical protein n=1 Tax=Actinomycetospora lutea TaxID=663604 RepID=UPI002367213C|nr:hypothetical protein [Actinomycetospora lutea]MDD7939614.1 hypothetical protein [Actinomycetospora lutea]